jgi:sugar/nucleoside kinase (ribokinase family)
VRAVVLGYASADHAVRVDALPAPDSTAIVRARLGTPWPRLGGCGPVIAAHLARAGLDAACVSWVADDAAGRRTRAALAYAGVDVAPIVVAGTRTASSQLVYAADGRAICIYDPGDAVGDGLHDAQASAIAAADLVCLTVAPAAATGAALDHMPAAATLVWSVKADRDAYPPELVARLLERADVVAFAHGERPFLAEQLGCEPAFRADALVVETRGAAGVVWRRGAETGEAAVQPIAVADTTGAGDAFVAGIVTRLVQDQRDAAAAVAAGIANSRALLEARIKEATA